MLRKATLAETLALFGSSFSALSPQVGCGDSLQVGDLRWGIASHNPFPLVVFSFHTQDRCSFWICHNALKVLPPMSSQEIVCCTIMFLCSASYQDACYSASHPHSAPTAYTLWFLFPTLKLSAPSVSSMISPLERSMKVKWFFVCHIHNFFMLSALLIHFCTDFRLFHLQGCHKIPVRSNLGYGTAHELQVPQIPLLQKVTLQETGQRAVPSLMMLVTLPQATVASYERISFQQQVTWINCTS